MDQLASITAWTPTSTNTPTSTSLKSVATTAQSALESSLSAALHSFSSYGTKINNEQYVSASRVIRGAQASLSIISAEQVLATATADNVKAQATELIWNSTQNLDDLWWDENVYDIRRLTRPGNIIFLVVFAISFLWYILILAKSRYWWFNIAFFCGAALEFLGFLGRVLSFNDMTYFPYYLLQLIVLTIAPAFIMGGIYFLLGQLVIIHGRQFSILKPLWYAYIFIACDVTSLVIQAIGGGIASVRAENYENADPGTYTMIAGIAFQVFSMSIYIIFWTMFLWRIYFPKTDKYPQIEPEKPVVDSQHLLKPSVKNFLKLLINSKTTAEYKKNVLEPYYNPKYADIRSRKLYDYFALAVSLAIIAVFVRCIYRVVELAQGFSGYLITHEVYIMCLDALMLFIALYIFIPFHPHIVFGASNIIRLGDIKENADQKIEEEVLYPIDDDYGSNGTKNGTAAGSPYGEERHDINKNGKFEDSDASYKAELGDANHASYPVEQVPHGSYPVDNNQVLHETHPTNNSDVYLGPYEPGPK
ncbi:Rta3 protein [Candida orthopsilosis Co 90-125]|uniref:Sphingoid long-chain base transporter RSB1 n=1 Tax=Candida orthopsilosis (strain 90-125) TaxID=1136231 RepID=H8WZU7_CANO9|nr:Rta3 protein [Candida orthopsilosis Co 90-125]CCG22292.1 Rta3 protein [Candida orthopsilosis Co 90-125]